MYLILKDFIGTSQEEKTHMLGKFLYFSLQPAGRPGVVEKAV